ncbi:hypothetical protein [Halioxenophilus sp. WMMB6]|uniref:COG4648 family protein n=1 Tax=Halioxenophilus sp. WMMB6 TaxID=3073815 RepID=UPI00295F4866|nr:hypothetical protein [Halioxenophilus sp. WMMB6]
MRVTFPVVLSLLAIAYPLTVYFGLQYMEPRAIGLLLAVLFGLRLWLSRGWLKGKVAPMLPVLALALLCALGAMLLNSHESLRLTPVFINFASLVGFAATLWSRQSMIERFARLTEPNLTPKAVRYTRKVTIVWILFFLGNGSFALYTAYCTSLAFWTLYNGLIAYGLMGMMFAGELLVRRWVRRGDE